MISKWPLARISVDPEYGLDESRTIVARVHRPAPERPFNLLGVYLPSGYGAQENRADMVDWIMKWIPSHGDDCMAIGGWNEELRRGNVGAAVAMGLLRVWDEVSSEPPRSTSWRMCNGEVFPSEVIDWAVATPGILCAARGQEPGFVDHDLVYYDVAR